MAVKQQEEHGKAATDTHEEPLVLDDGLNLPNHRIRDHDSFDSVTSGARGVAGLYFYQVLGNPLIDVAAVVARDFFGRPQMFTESGDPRVAPLLARLYARMGNDETIPSREQRAAIFTPLFGESSSNDGVGDFVRLRAELVGAASAFAERSVDTGVEMLRERVRETHRPFREYLTGLEGASTGWSRTDALPTVTEGLSFSILRSKSVSSVYGISVPPGQTWPYNEDSNGDKLVEEISKRGTWSNGASGTLTREGFSNLQRAALRGAEALATIIDFTEDGSDADLNQLITKCYTWGSALTGLIAQSGLQPVG